jgi:excisionase family DNA binding protein
MVDAVHNESSLRAGWNTNKILQDDFKIKVNGGERALGPAASGSIPALRRCGPETADLGGESESLTLSPRLLAQWLAVSRIRIFKLAKAGRIACCRVGTCVRFDPRAVTAWLRKM